MSILDSEEGILHKKTMKIVINMYLNTYQGVSGVYLRN